MILSVSRRTDIPAFFPNWLINRIEAGFVDVRNPFNIRQISRVDISPQVVDCMVFWTKNPAPLLPKLNLLNAYQYYFQFTLNPYNQNIEKQVPRKRSLINTFKHLSDTIGKHRVVWRYDPVLLSPAMDFHYHLTYFERIAKELSGYTTVCMISFPDMYKKCERNLQGTGIATFEQSEAVKLSEELSKIARVYDITLKSCAESLLIGNSAVLPGKCIDNRLIEQLCGYPVNARKDKNQRKLCGCIESIDIGEYNTCLHHCLYCYANYNRSSTEARYRQHYPDSSLLTGKITDKDVIKKRSVTS